MKARMTPSEASRFKRFEATSCEWFSELAKKTSTEHPVKPRRVVSGALRRTHLIEIGPAIRKLRPRDVCGRRCRGIPIILQRGLRRLRPSQRIVPHFHFRASRCTSIVAHRLVSKFQILFERAIWFDAFALQHAVIGAHSFFG